MRDMKATDQQRVLYENQAIRLIEFTIKPGQKAPRQPLPAVLAFDSIPAFDAVDKAIGPRAGRSEAPTGMIFPRCITAPGNAALPAATAASGPIHFYEIAFKRVDGTGLKDHWREWYPDMVAMQKGPLRP